MSNIDPKRFWSDKALAAKVASKVTVEVASVLAEAGEAIGIDPIEGLDEAIEKDIEAQRAAQRHGEEP